MAAITMNFHLFDLAGFIGVLLIVVAYLLLQLDKLPSSSPRYSLLNAAGAALIMVSLVFKFNLSAFIVEAFWFLISLLGLWRSLISQNNSQRSARMGTAANEVRSAEVRASAPPPRRSGIARIVFPKPRRIAENCTERALGPYLKIAQQQRHQRNQNEIESVRSHHEHR